MSGVWVFKNGVLRLEGNPGGGGRGRGRGSGSGPGGGQPHVGGSWRRKVLVHLPTEEVITSHEMLESRLRELGWEHYPSTPELIQYHKRSSVHLISVPRDFSRFTSVHMYDIVVKCRNVFVVRDA